MPLNYLGRRNSSGEAIWEQRIEPRMGPQARSPNSEVFDTGGKTIVDCAHVRVERLDTQPVLFSKVFKEFEDRKGQKYDYRYWAERENFFLREFLKRQHQFSHVVQARHLISENEAAKQVLTCDAGITIADWLRVKPRYPDTATLSHPFQRSDAFLRLLRACLVALKQLHSHRIVHCDIKEDNICIPYAPNPFPGDGARIHLEFEQLKLIDFAFSIAHAIPLTQILVINPDERLPYQSELLIAALRADRRSGSPNAVQQLDYRVDLFGLGYMAEKISAAGLDGPCAAGEPQAFEEIRRLVQRLKEFDSAPGSGPLPHDGLIAEVDRLLLNTAGLSGSPEFSVEGEWTAEEMAEGRGAGRKTPLTPVASALPTPVALPLAQVAQRPAGLSGRRVALLLGLALAVAGGGLVLYQEAGETGLPPALREFVKKKDTAPAQPPPAAEEAGKRLVSLLRSDEDLVFQAALGELGQLMASNQPAVAAIAESVATEYGDALASAGPQAARSRALSRLNWMAKAGYGFAAQRLAAFETDYDQVKQKVARSVWWVRGHGVQPEAAARWMDDGMLLAENGDRPAMLDLAFAVGRGRALKPDRVIAVETYLKVIARSEGGDGISTRLRQSALRGLAAMLNSIVELRDHDAAKRLMPALESNAESADAERHYYLGLLSECVARPARLDAARQWYRKAAADPAWKRAADHRARRLGRWCPRGATAGGGS